MMKAASSALKVWQEKNQPIDYDEVHVMKSKTK